MLNERTCMNLGELMTFLLNLFYYNLIVDKINSSLFYVHSCFSLTYPHIRTLIFFMLGIQNCTLKILPMRFLCVNAILYRRAIMPHKQLLLHHYRSFVLMAQSGTIIVLTVPNAFKRF